MKYRNFIFALSLAPALLFGLYQERVKEVHLVYDPVDPSILENQPLKEIRDTLKLKQTTLTVTNLEHEKDSDKLSYVVVYNKPDFLKGKTLAKFPMKKAVLFMWEPPVVQKNLYTSRFTSKFKRVYTWNDDLVDNKKFFKFYYPVLQPMRDNLPNFENRKLLTQISGCKKSKHKNELYSERVKVIKHFEDKPDGEFEFYGTGWEKERKKHYKGAIADKLEALKNYKFSVCYENMNEIKGYVTEKIFDCFAVGTIPIYWGASNITDYVPKNCFIDRRDFASFEEVLSYIRSMDAQTYEEYLTNIRAFLASDQAKFFSQEMFNVIFLEAIRFP